MGRLKGRLMEGECQVLASFSVCVEIRVIFFGVNARNKKIATSCNSFFVVSRVNLYSHYRKKKLHDFTISL